MGSAWLPCVCVLWILASILSNYFIHIFFSALRLFEFICGSSIQCQTLACARLTFLLFHIVRMSEWFRAIRRYHTLATQKKEEKKKTAIVIYDGFWRCGENSIWFELRFIYKWSTQRALRRAVINRFLLLPRWRSTSTNIFAIDFLPINSPSLRIIVSSNSFSTAITYSIVT